MSWELNNITELRFIYMGKGSQKEKHPGWEAKNALIEKYSVYLILKLFPRSQVIVFL